MDRASTVRWITVGVWVAVIYATIPFVRRLRVEFVSHWPAEFIGFAVMGTVAIAAAATLWMMRRSRTKVAGTDIVWILGIAAFTLGWTWQLMDRPEETVHFLEYGVLAVLLYRALRLHIDNSGVFVAGALVGMIVGTFDEIIQWVTPDRYWDYRDLALNGGASALAQLAIWRFAPKSAHRVTPRTARLLIRLAFTEMVVLTLCLSTTPQRLEVLARDLPVLAPLAESDDVMAEYGYRHRLDTRTIFRSRLSRAQLTNQDRLRADETAALLDRFGRRYGAFRQSVSAAGDPFAYEARVHIFARDRSLAAARRSEVGSRQHLRSMTESARENLILTHAFGATLEQSTFRWPEKLRAAVDAAQDPNTRYVSDAAGHLITWVSEPVLRTTMVAAIVLLGFADRLLGRRINSRRRRPEPE